MPKPAEQVKMSSIVPRFLIRSVERFIENHIPLRWWDPLHQFWIETRLIFSRAILLLAGALFAVFSWAAIENGEHLSEKDAFDMLGFQVVILSILLNMNLWEVEREGRTFELLIMRIPNLHRLIWFKMRVSLFWTLFIAIPFFAAYGWFLSIPFQRMLLFYVFHLSFAALVACATCVVASFVHHGLTSGIVTFIMACWVMAVSDNGRLPYIDFYRPFANPFKLALKDLSYAQTAGVLLVNRAVLALAIAGFYGWLLRRLAKTEKWIQ